MLKAEIDLRSIAWYITQKLHTPQSAGTLRPSSLRTSVIMTLDKAVNSVSTPEQKNGKGLAITALVFGILAILTGLLSPVAIVCGLVAIILAAVSIKNHKGLAVAGLITGIIGLLVGFVSGFIWVVALTTINKYVTNDINKISEIEAQHVKDEELDLVKEMYANACGLVATTVAEVEENCTENGMEVMTWACDQSHLQGKFSTLCAELATNGLNQSDTSFIVGD